MEIEADSMEYEDAEVEDFDDLDHPVMLALRDNLYKVLGLNPAMSNDQAVDKAREFLENAWNDSAIGFDKDDNIIIDNELYTYVLENVFIKLYEDMNFILKSFVPIALKGMIDSDLPFRAVIDKLAFNVMFPLELSGYQYPQCDPPYRPAGEFSSYKNTEDNAWRGGWETDHDQVTEAADIIPDSWQSAVKEYLARTVEYLYGDPNLVDYERADDGAAYVEEPQYTWH